MNESMNWDDLRLFVSVASHGGLAGAALETGLSGPTLGRRMLALERALGRDLFSRHAKGYDLTDEGHALLARTAGIVGQLDAIAAPITGRTVKISAGVWTTRALCERAAGLAQNDVTLRFVAADHLLDILHREVVIGVRNRRPEQVGLAGQKVGRVQFAVYGTQGAPWARVMSNTPSARWVADQAGRTIEVTHPTHALDLARVGAARAVLPTFIAETIPDLAKIGGVISDLTHDQWVVSHDADRHLPEVRDCLTRVVSALKSL